MTWAPLTDAQRDGSPVLIRDSRVRDARPMVGSYVASDPAFPWHVTLSSGETDQFPDHEHYEWRAP